MFGMKFIGGPAYGGPNAVDMIGGLIIGTLFFGALDFLVARHTKARWFACHLFANLVVVVLSMSDVITAIRDPAMSGTGEYNLIPVYSIFSIHVYHMIAPGFKLKFGDYVHHILFGGVICALGMVDNIGPVCNVISFTLSGLPGGMDYFMMILVKHGIMEQLDEKRYNARINVWLRAPGTLLAAFMMWTISMDVENRTDWIHWYTKYAAWLCAFLCYVNGLFYMQQVAVSTARKDAEYSC